MIERATACLKSGAARKSLRSASSSSRSRRLLHSTFWNHGAGDLDLPPSLLPVTQPPIGLPLQGDSPLHNSSTTPRRSKRRQGDVWSQEGDVAASDGIFLDFLYPPQALAWLQRANTQQIQRWERRNIRRLPEGFIVASRGYASSSRRDGSRAEARSDSLEHRTEKQPKAPKFDPPDSELETDNGDLALDRIEEQADSLKTSGSSGDGDIFADFSGSTKSVDYDGAQSSKDGMFIPEMGLSFGGGERNGPFHEIENDHAQGEFGTNRAKDIDQDYWSDQATRNDGIDPFRSSSLEGTNTQIIDRAQDHRGTGALLSDPAAEDALKQTDFDSISDGEGEAALYDDALKSNDVHPATLDANLDSLGGSEDLRYNGLLRLPDSQSAHALDAVYTPFDLPDKRKRTTKRKSRDLQSPTEALELDNANASMEDSIVEPELPIPDSQSGRLQHLNFLLSSTSNQTKDVGRATSMRFTSHLLKTYDLLDETSREDLKLRSELLSWLCAQGNDVGNTRGLEIFAAMDASQRSASDYAAAAIIRFRLNQGDEVKRIHAEALQRLQDGTEVSIRLFRYVLERGWYRFAASIQAQHSEAYAAADSTSQILTFWQRVSEMPDFFSRAASLATMSPSQSPNDRSLEFENFRGAFYSQAIRKEFLSIPEEQSVIYQHSVDKRRLGPVLSRMIHAVIKISENASELLEPLFSTLMRSDSKLNYLEIHGAVSLIYRGLINNGIVPSKDLFLAFLRKLTVRESQLEVDGAKTTIIGVADDWKRFHGKLSIEVFSVLLEHFAKIGDEEKHSMFLQYLFDDFPAYDDRKDALWTSVYIFARRAELEEAQSQFEKVARMAAASGSTPEIRCWNALLYAHQRTDDLDGAIHVLLDLTSKPDLTPDIHSFLPVAELLSKRGDVAGVKTLMTRYDEATSAKRSTSLFACLIRAHLRNDDVQGAEDLLQDLVHRVANSEVEGTLSCCANVLLDFHGSNADLQSVNRIYRLMKSESIPLDLGTYAGLCQCFCTLRQPYQARRIISTLMPRSGVRPTALHYAIVVNGYIKVDDLRKARGTYTEMKDKGIAESLSSRIAFLRLNASIESDQKLPSNPSTPPLPLKDTIEKLFAIMDRGQDVQALASDDSEVLPGFSNLADAVPGSLFERLISIHGRRRCFDTVQELFQRYMTSSQRAGRSPSIPMRLITPLMETFNESGDFDSVEACWNLAKEQADRESKWTSIPKSSSESGGKSEDAVNAFQLKARVSTDSSTTSKRRPKATDSVTGQTGQVSATPAPGRKYLLSRPLRQYLTALHNQKRTKDEISVFTGVLTQGYAIDTRAWNLFIRHLCTRTPPMALLAFVLTEQFLIEQFPGWTYKRRSPGTGDRLRGSQHMVRDEILRGIMLPEYNTLVLLGGALLDLRQMEMAGLGATDKTLEQYIGNIRAIRKRAPRTLYAVQSIPQFPDGIQEAALRLDYR